MIEKVFQALKKVFIDYSYRGVEDFHEILNQNGYGKNERDDIFENLCEAFQYNGFTKEQLRIVASHLGLALKCPVYYFKTVVISKIMTNDQNKV